LKVRYPLLISHFFCTVTQKINIYFKKSWLLRDATELLKSGSNAVGAVVGSGWYKGELAGWVGRRNIYGDRTAFLFQMRIRYSDGRETLTVSDGEWKTAEGLIPYSELYHGETYDARLEQEGWNIPEFDDSAWSPAQILDHVHLIYQSFSDPGQYELFFAALAITKQPQTRQRPSVISGHLRHNTRRFSKSPVSAFISGDRLFIYSSILF
jgi:hypothetical protein